MCTTCFWNNLYKVCSKSKVWQFRCLTTRVHILIHMIQTLCFPKIEIKMRKEQISLFRLAIGIVRPVWYCLFFTLFVNIFYVICVCLRIVVSNKYWVIFALCLSSSCAPLLPVSLDCPFLIAPSVFSNVYLKKRVTIYILMVQFFPFATSTGKYIVCPREKWSLTNSFLASSQVIMGIHWPCYCTIHVVHCDSLWYFVWFNSATFLCLSQTRIWISNVICCGSFCVCSMIWGEMWLFGVFY